MAGADLSRRHRPADVAEVHRILALVDTMRQAVAMDYAALHGSGYQTAHRKDTQAAGDPADLLTGTPQRARHFLTRASEGIDAAFAGLASARYWLGRIEVQIDLDATPGGIDPDLPEASPAEVRRARQSQQQRNARVRQNGAPWAGEEVTG